MPKSRPFLERFCTKIAFGDFSGCWIFLGARQSRGYGYIQGPRIENSKPRMLLAHRAMWELVKHQAIADGMTLDHLCRNRRCVNPDHLEMVPQWENLMRGESGPAQNARKTHCPQGHPLKGENIAINYDKRTGRYGRQCRICKADYMRAWKARRAAPMNPPLESLPV